MDNRYAKFCDYQGQVGKCGVFVSYSEGSRCLKHQDKPLKAIREKIGKYSGPSKYQEEIGSWQGFNRKKQ